MKNSSISSSSSTRSALVLLLVALLALPGGSEAAKKNKKKHRLGAEDLTNFLLGPEHSQWLLGAISEMATDRDLVLDTRETFSMCPGCNRVYWKGSHTERIKRFVDQLLADS